MRALTRQERASAQVGTPAACPQLPAYALDGRPLYWNESQTAVAFDSTDDEYHSDEWAASASALKLMDRSPAHLHAERQRQQLLRANGMRQKTSKYEFGTAVHAAVLEPQRFKQTYLIHPGNRGKTTKSFKDFELANPGKRVLMQTELNDIIGCANSLRSATVIRTKSAAFTMADLVDIGTPERNYYWLDAQTGLTCKARMDLTIENIVIDVKTAQDARGERFKYDAAKFGYHIQAAFYMEGF